MKALGDEHRIKRVLGQVERSLADSDDPLVLLRFRCALGAINGGLVMSAHAREREEGPAPLAGRAAGDHGGRARGDRRPGRNRGTRHRPGSSPPPNAMCHLDTGCGRPVGSAC